MCSRPPQEVYFTSLIRKGHQTNMSKRKIVRAGCKARGLLIFDVIFRYFLVKELLCTILINWTVQ